MLSNYRIAVVVPAYNEQLLIDRTIASIPHFVDEIIIVDDGSEDETVERVLAQPSDRRISLVQHVSNFGVGAAIATGYQVSLELGCDIAVVMGADAQMDPEDMTSLLWPIMAGEADYVKGNRFAWPAASKMIPPVRFYGGWVLSVLTRAASGYWDIVDSQCGFTAIRRGVLEQLELDQIYPRYGYPNDMLVRLGDLDARLIQCPVRPVYAGERSDLRVWRVLIPISTILLKATVRRLWNRSRRVRLPIFERVGDRKPSDSANGESSRSRTSVRVAEGRRVCTEPAK